jgi:hypothetical protein
LIYLRKVIGEERDFLVKIAKTVVLNPLFISPPDVLCKFAKLNLIGRVTLGGIFCNENKNHE